MCFLSGNNVYTVLEAAATKWVRSKSLTLEGKRHTPANSVHVGVVPPAQAQLFTQLQSGHAVTKLLIAHLQVSGNNPNILSVAVAIHVELLTWVTIALAQK